MFQDWQRTLTQSSVTVRKGPRQRMDVRFCEAGTTCREAYVRTAGFWQLRFYALLPARVRRIFFLDKRLTWRSANLTLPDYGRVARDSGVMSALILMSICCGPSRKDFSSGFSPRCDTKFIIYNSTGVRHFSILCYAKTRSRVMRRLFQASIHDEDHPERPCIGSGNLLVADVCGP